MRFRRVRRRADDQQDQDLAQEVLLLLGLPQIAGLDESERWTRRRHLLPSLLRPQLRTQGRGLRSGRGRFDNVLNEFMYT